MALEISSKYLNMGRADDRISGLLPNAFANSVGVFGGMVVTQDPSASPTGDGHTFKLYDGAQVVSATWPFGLGLVIEPTPGQNTPASGDNASGRGFTGSEFAAYGDVYSAIHSPGMFVDVFDDLRSLLQCAVNGANQNKSCPFVNNRNWAIGDVIYASAASLDDTLGRGGLLDNANAAGAGGLRVGFLRAVNTGDAGGTVLTIELNMEIVA